MKRDIKGIGVKLVVSALVLSIVFGAIPALASPAPVVSVSPAEQTVNPGATFSINITVDPDGKGISSGQLWFAFNASVMQVDSVTAGNLLGPSPIPIGPFINNTAGTVEYALGRVGLTTPPTPAGTFATITITVNGAAPSGTYSLDITDMGLADENFNPIGGIVINDGTVTVPGVAPDTTPPTTTVTPTPPMPPSGWWTTPVLLTFNRVDNGGGNISGVAYTNYSMTGATLLPWTVVAGDVDFTDNVTAEGETTVWYYSVDNAGNDESEVLGYVPNMTVRINLTAVVTNIEVSPLFAQLNVTETQLFTATVYDQFGAPMTGVNITWNSSNENVGTVSPSWSITDPTGNATTTFTANDTGTTLIYATHGLKFGVASVTVYEPEVTTIEVEPPTAVVVVGDTEQFTATAYDQHGNVMPDVVFTWSVSNDTVGSVNETTGLFTALAEGETLVNATADNLNGSASVTVVPDTTPPTVEITSPTETETFTTATITVTGTATDNVAVTSVTVNGVQVTNITPGPSVLFSGSLTLAAGANTITVVAGDRAGNTGSDIVNVTYSPPTPTPPVYKGGGGGAAPRDSDGDGYSDIDEMLAGTDPNDPNDYPGKLAVTPTPTPTPTPKPTATPTIPPTATPTPKPTPTPTPSPTPRKIPGFEAVFAIAGLLAIAYLVLRRRK